MGRTTLIVATVAALAISLSVERVGATAPTPRVISIAEVARQSLPTPPGADNQSGVVVQAQIAASPAQPALAAAVTEAGLQKTPAGTFGVELMAAQTRNGGRSWSSEVVPGVTVEAGGRWQGISWPTDAVGPDGTIYVAASLRQRLPCHTGLGVLSSADGGRTFGPLVVVQRERHCDSLAGRSSLVFDDAPRSPHRGRLYLAWTAYYSDSAGADTGQVQTLSYSDDHGRTWSTPSTITAPGSSTFGNTLLVGPDGKLTDVYASNSADFTSSYIDASISTDGGLSFGAPVRIADWDYASVGAENIRCCAPSATIDPITGQLYTTFGDARFQAGEYDDALLYRSPDGLHWSGPVQADTVSPRPGLEHMTPEVAAYGGIVYVTWALTADPNGFWVRQQVAVSTNSGHRFGVPVTLGPDGDLHYAALASGFGYWLADVTGVAAVPGRAYLAWPLPTAPTGGRPEHQTLWAATVAAR